MRITIPQHHFSLEPSTEWVADDMDPEAVDSFGIYLRSLELGVFLNVRPEDAGDHPLTADGLTALLREQSWASAPFDEWLHESGPLIIVGGTFETVGMGGEVVLEVFATDGRSLANLVGPGERAVIAALVPSVKRLAGTLHFE
ncbi:MAG TPA: hypothetical protein VHU80_09845 [Polyangiaceae bacterium]|jgi:hypothetical protein|nr:hypothetical protein [Polyangiaceae bacterium]